MLKYPNDPLGYTGEEVQSICDERKISYDVFWKVFGVNTCAVAGDGTLRYYVSDVERTLYDLRCRDGRYHTWD
jgi:hypothetical protein